MKFSSVLLDTHILLWILVQSRRLKDLPWLYDYSPWIVSPISLLEIKFLIEVKRLDLEFQPTLLQLKRDANFYIDSVPLEDICFQAMDISWTRDPFDRLLVAHSQLRKIPLGTCDEWIRKNYQQGFL